MQLGGERVEPQLVHLEQAELARDTPARARGGEQRGGDSPGHVRPGLVVHERYAGALENRGEDRRESWSCRSSPTRARCPAAGALRARRSPRDRGASGPSPARSTRHHRAGARPRRRPAPGRAWVRAAQPSAICRGLGRLGEECSGGIYGRWRGEGRRGERRGGSFAVTPAGTSTETAPRTARTRTGSSPIGSPSAYIVKGRSAETPPRARGTHARSAPAHACP